MKYWLSLSIIIIYNLSFGQSKNDNFPHSSSFRINILGLPFKNISFVADQRIKSNNFLEISTGYQFSTISLENKFLFFSNNDPSWYYSRFKVGLGINHYFSGNFYFGSQIQYRYSSFEKILFSNYIDHEGDAFNEDWEISRKK